jgi:hypothetical protein
MSELHPTMVTLLTEACPNRRITPKNIITRHPNITTLQYPIIITKMSIMNITKIMSDTSGMNVMKIITHMNTKRTILKTVDVTMTEIN